VVLLALILQLDLLKKELQLEETFVIIALPFFQSVLIVLGEDICCGIGGNPNPAGVIPPAPAPDNPVNGDGKLIIANYLYNCSCFLFADCSCL
jgi:hypothetical protein